MMIIDNGGRRIGVDRRFYIYNGYLPERRSGRERRSGSDRRRFPRSREICRPDA
ncbi:hypothetical protein [Desulfosarcina cetonica]|uniref:hypothetical protein n=1 Tax=Desulfosarcina cetonica TaxID=90730 RepID=UPI0012ED5BB8|nr:hypothetical protein [Desulfosarcina cetonica]